MINEKVFLGLPLSFKQDFLIYPPTIQEVIENDFFSVYKKLLTITQEEIEDEYTEQDIKVEHYPTPLEYLMINCYSDKRIFKLTEQAFKFFLKEDVLINTDKKIISIKKNKHYPYIEEKDYFDFQNLIRESLGEKKVEKPNPDENPRIKRMKAKARLRDKVKAKQGSGLQLSTCLASICCMGIGITPLNIGQISYANISVLMEMYQNKDNFSIDFKRALAGAKDAKPKYWIRNLE